MSDLVSEHIQDISLQLHQYSVSMQKSPQKVTEDFLVDGVGFANYFSEFFINGLSVLIHQDKVNTLELLQNKSVQQFFANNPKFALDIIRLLGQKKQYLAIKSLAETVLSKHPNYLEFIVQKSLALLDLRYYNETDIFCREMLKKYPNDFTLNEVYARNAHRQDKWEEALQRWLGVVRCFPRSKNPIAQLYFVAGKCENPDLKNQAYHLLSDIDGYDSDHKTIKRLATAKVSEFDGNYMVASYCYQGVLVNDCNHQEALRGLMLCYAQLGEMTLLKNHLVWMALSSKLPSQFKVSMSKLLYDLSLNEEVLFFTDYALKVTNNENDRRLLLSIRDSL